MSPIFGVRREILRRCGMRAGGCLLVGARQSLPFCLLRQGTLAVQRAVIHVVAVVCVRGNVL